MDSIDPLVLLLGAVLGLGILVYLGARLFLPMAAGAVADARRRALAWPSAALVAVASLFWLVLVASVVVAGVRAAGALG